VRCLAGALAAAALGIVALSPGGPGWLAWGALVPLFVTLGDAPARGTVPIVILYALVLGVGGLAPWLAPAAATYFKLGSGRALAYVIAFLIAIFTLHGAFLGALLAARPRRVGPRQVLWCGAAWAVWDGARTAVFPRFPGAVLALSQHAAIPALQLASVTGVAGVTFVLVTFNAGLAALFARGARRARLAAAATGAALATGALAWGMLRVPAQPSAMGPEIAAVDVRAASESASTLERYLAATEEAAARRPALILWPESALTRDIEHDRIAWNRLDAFLEGHGIPLLAGGLTTVRRTEGGLARFNSAHLLVPGHGMQSYHKRRLVAFAERWPAFLGSPPVAVETLEPGREATVFRLGDAAFGVLICFEITDAASARALAAGGAHFLVNLTNDAWFAEAPHLPWAAVRAVETGLPVVRAANAGTSAVFDRFGRPVATSRPAGAPAVFAARVPEAVPTIYARSGDVFLVLCAAIVLTGVAGRAFRGRG